MKQILQSLKDGRTELAEVPVPLCGPGMVLIGTRRTLVSAGTERMLVDFGKASLIDKARQQPDKVRMVLDKVKTDGLAPTLEAVRNKLDQPLALGYCQVGVVLEVGVGVTGFSPGERVVSNGKHAEAVAVPVNLCARVPDEVDDESAAFTVLAAIGLQGIRLANPTLGECVAVTGLGLIGLLTVQLLRAQGCRVLGIDFDPDRLTLARRFGAETVNPGAGADVVGTAERFSRGRGLDAVIITASTQSNQPMSQAAQMCRKRGRIVLVGVAGLELSRADFYEKELSFQVSCSYGPGRYDPSYEEGGQDYPVGFVRWTEQRNFEAVLDMLASGQLDVKPLISHRFALDRALEAYDLLSSGEPSLGIVLEYPGLAEVSRTAALGDSLIGSKPSRRSLLAPWKAASIEGKSPSRLRLSGVTRCVASFIGSGNYATSVLIPAFKEAGAVLHCVASSGGVSGVHAGRKFGFAETTTDAERLLEDGVTNMVVISTRHDSHAKLVVRAMRAGKHVFVEKPLCLTMMELGEIEAELAISSASSVQEEGVNPSGITERVDVEHSGAGWSASSGYEAGSLPEAFLSGAEAAGPSNACLLMVGFNRRFSPLVMKMKSLLSGFSAPKAMVMTVNAGAIPSVHWTQDPGVGGGRILGEACHFIDLLRHLAGAPIVSHDRLAMESVTGDTVSLQLGFADGSIGTIHYFANGNKAVSKERLEVFCGGRILQLDNFRQLTGFGWPGFTKMKLWRQDKGQKACAAAFVEAVEQGGPAPIPLSEILEVSRITIRIAEN